MNNDTRRKITITRKQYISGIITQRQALAKILDLAMKSGMKREKAIKVARDYTYMEYKDSDLIFFEGGAVNPR